MEKTKIIKNIDHKIWLSFRAVCVGDGVKMGHRLNDVLSSYLKNKGDEQ